MAKSKKQKRIRVKKVRDLLTRASKLPLRAPKGQRAPKGWDKVETSV